MLSSTKSVKNQSYKVTEPLKKRFENPKTFGKRVWTPGLFTGTA